MVTLPLDLLPYFLSSLDKPDLERCCLVARDFYHTARPFQFSRLVLDSKTWKLKCRFLLDSPGSQFLKYIKSLKLEIISMPLFRGGEEMPSSLLVLLQRLQGHHLDSLCIDARPDECKWNDLHSTFRKGVFDILLPHITSLELLSMVNLPISWIARRCPKLVNMELGSEHKYIAKLSDIEREEPIDSNVTSLSFFMFGTRDFETDRSLGQYILHAGTKINSLELTQYMPREEFPMSLDFLQCLGSLTQQLHHLSIGPQLYYVVVSNGGGCNTLQLALFPHLQTLQLSLSTGDQVAGTEAWAVWTAWVAQMLVPDADYSRSLKILRFLMYPDGTERKPTALNDLAVGSDFEIHVHVDGTGQNSERFGQTVSSIRASLGTWDAADKLKFWMRLGMLKKETDFETGSDSEDEE
ncbi:hypothetical protein DL96DRAFT_1810781 [Flagelloscypha sp. PMI_526]|nr:hypothetical protein DL96DRAFT_1810781 [Flagelloscypha sp. PMI_526]